MTNKAKSWVYAGAAGAVLAVLAAMAVDHPARRQTRETPPTSAAAPVRAQAAAEPAAAPVPAAPAVPTAAPLLSVSPILPLPPDATSVPDEDLLKLAGMVDLAGAQDHQPDKKRWEQALAIAENLNSGPCDCEQRNWLNHFVEMGNYALAGAEQEYRQSAQLMATLGRNDQNAMDISRHPD